MHQVQETPTDGSKTHEEVQAPDTKNRRHRYEWGKAVPINGNPKSDSVDFFDYQLIVNGKTNDHNSWLTNIDVTENNVVELVKIGQARWKIENKTFNALKNQGYHIEHNSC